MFQGNETISRGISMAIGSADWRFFIQGRRQAIQPLVLSLDRQIEIAPMQFYEYSIFLESTQLSIGRAVPRSRANPSNEIFPRKRCRITFPVPRPIRRGNSVSTTEIIFAHTSNRDLSTEQCPPLLSPFFAKSNLLPIKVV